MTNSFGYVRVAAAIPFVRVADCTYNISRIEALADRAEAEGVEVVVFPELCVCGYTCADLLAQQLLLDKCEEALAGLLAHTRGKDVVCIVGMPVRVRTTLMNCAVVVQGGEVLGVVPKSFPPNYGEFYEARWFASARETEQEADTYLCGRAVPFGADLMFNTGRMRFAVELCEDLWAPVPPSSQLSLRGAEVIFNLSATDELVGKHSYLNSLLAQQSARCMAGYVYASCGWGESTQDVVYAGNAIICENGARLAASERFRAEEQLVVTEIDCERLRAERRRNTTFRTAAAAVKQAGRAEVACKSRKAAGFGNLTRSIDPHPFVPAGAALDERCEEIFSIQTAGLAKRVAHTGARHIVVGVSGGLDSTLALLVCAKTMDFLGRSRTDVVGVTMPGFGTTDRTYHNAVALMGHLGVTIREISIRKACEQHFKDIGHDPSAHDVTYENAQARERTQILMDLANQLGGFVVGTGDVSEMALGWATYNADHMSNYNVNCSIPKTLVRHLVRWVAVTDMDEKSRETLLDIVDTPISPELIPADEQGNIKQITEDIVGPYELHDFFLYYFLRMGFRPAKILWLAKQAFCQPHSGEAAAPYGEAVVEKWLRVFCRRFFTQQFKRSCMPDGPKVGSVSLSPRGDWRMPSDGSPADWLADLE